MLAAGIANTEIINEQWDAAPTGSRQRLRQIPDIRQIHRCLRKDRARQGTGGSQEAIG